jgi:uncharacterized protein YdiU (UPF0061 family)
VDFTLFFRLLGEAAEVTDRDGAVRALFADPAAYDGWAEQWRARLAGERQDGAARRAAMAAVNPAFIPRNHQIEAVIAAALDDDLGPFERLLAITSRPFDDQPDAADYAAPPQPHERVLATFCGT